MKTPQLKIYIKFFAFARRESKLPDQREMFSCENS